MDIVRGYSGGGSDGGIVEPPGEGKLPVGVFCGELADADCQLDEVSKFDEVMFGTKSQLQ